jgi:hypothetical protein
MGHFNPMAPNLACRKFFRGTEARWGLIRGRRAQLHGYLAATRQRSGYQKRKAVNAKCRLQNAVAPKVIKPHSSVSLPTGLGQFAMAQGWHALAAVGMLTQRKHATRPPNLDSTTLLGMDGRIWGDSLTTSGKHKCPDRLE